MNTQKKVALAVYVANYVMEEMARGNTTVDRWMILDAINAFEGGAYDIDIPAIEDGPVDWPTAKSL